MTRDLSCLHFWQNGNDQRRDRHPVNSEHGTRNKIEYAAYCTMDAMPLLQQDLKPSGKSFTKSLSHALRVIALTSRANATIPCTGFGYSTCGVSKALVRYNFWAMTPFRYG